MIPRPDLPPTSFPDVMCDLETTHTAPDRGHILQIAAVRFNLRTQEYDPVPLNICLHPMMSHRMWSESTRDWWLGKPETSALNRLWLTVCGQKQHANGG